MGYRKSGKYLRMQRRLLKSKVDFWNPKKDAKIQAKKDFEIHASKAFEIHAKKTFEIQRRMLKSNQKSTYLYLGHVTNCDLLTVLV